VAIPGLRLLHFARNDKMAKAYARNEGAGEVIVDDRSLFPVIASVLPQAGAWQSYA